MVSKKNMETKEKYDMLLEKIRAFGSAAVAFSGGTDSTLLAYAAAEALGRENMFCVTARALSFPERELEEAKSFCAEQGIRHEIIDFDELSVAGFAENPPDRCYLCKYALFSMFKEFAEKEGAETVIEGSNTDDTGDYRPGMKAVSELGIKSPLCEAGLTKAEVRAVLKELGLSVWDKPPLACLSTRFPYGEEITAEKLNMVGKAEQYLFDKGYSQVRVRMHGTGSYTARIETLPEMIEGLAKEPLRSEVEGYLKSIGFTWVSLDMTGYIMGSMNEGLSEEEKELERFVKTTR